MKKKRKRGRLRFLKRGEGKTWRLKLKSKRRQKKRERGRKPRSPRNPQANLVCMTLVDRHKPVLLSRVRDHQEMLEMMKSTKEEMATLNQPWLQRLLTLPICP